jgi:hypothetical protein
MTPKPKALSTQNDSAGLVTVKYKGQNGEFVPGIPTRDLTPEEWAALPERLRHQAIQADLYMAVTKESEGI